MRVGKIRLERQRRPVLGHCLFQPALVVKRIAEVIVCLGILGLENRLQTSSNAKTFRREPAK